MSLFFSSPVAALPSSLPPRASPPLTPPPRRRGLRWVTPLAGDFAGRLTKQGFLLFLPPLVLRLHNLVGIAGEVLQQIIGGGCGIHANPMLWR